MRHLVDEHMLGHLPHLGRTDWEVLVLLDLVPGQLASKFHSLRKTLRENDDVNTCKGSQAFL